MDELEGLIDRDRLESWAGSTLPGDDGPLAVRRITTGGANELFELRRRDQVWVLRRPLRVPQDAAASNRIMAREFRVLGALAGTTVPHPKPVALCEDPGVIGAAFYIMERVEGITTDGALPDVFAHDPQAQRNIGLEAIDALAALHRVDWQAAGLADFGRPDGFLNRQVDRWLSHLDRHRVREIEGIDEVGSWLREHQPVSGPPTIMHGDYTPHNWMFAAAPPTRLVAVVDWEQSTIGDPLMDLGHLLAGWADPGEPPRFASYLEPRDHLPSRAELLERYATATGRDVSMSSYYEVMALYKLACVMEGNYTLFATGRSTTEKHRRAGELVPRLVQAALATSAG
ncbi:phosphotransferase family protein [Pseudonocardia ailaonensis]|uniref:Phosphotransferase family protein n=1 Tax=Pseudonocardia ailaonensis TaxID=367279 RepID=A0ABN2NDR0_9PSEU